MVFRFHLLFSFRNPSELVSGTRPETLKNFVEIAFKGLLAWGSVFSEEFKISRFPPAIDPQSL